MPVTVNPAAASKLLITTPPSATATAGQPFATQPVITEEDQYGNVETGDNSTQVTASLASGTGPLQGTTNDHAEERRGDVHQPGRQHSRDNLARLLGRRLDGRRAGNRRCDGRGTPANW